MRFALGQMDESIARGQSIVAAFLSDCGMDLSGLRSRERMSRLLSRHKMRDVFAISGTCLLSVGAGIAWLPLGLIVPGALLLAAGLYAHFRGGPVAS